MNTTNPPAGAIVVESAPTAPVSVQVQTTRITSGEAVTVSQHDTSATHWSVYVRGVNGLADHDKDFKISDGRAMLSALAHAALLSMKLGVPVEPIA